jgi:hypothetical protein
MNVAEEPEVTSPERAGSAVKVKEREYVPRRSILVQKANGGIKSGGSDRKGCRSFERERVLGRFRRGSRSFGNLEKGKEYQCQGCSTWP